MRTIQVKVSDTDLNKYKLGSEQVIKFTDLVEKVNLEYAKRALYDCNEIAKKTGLSKMSLGEINTEIKAVRDAKNNT